MRSYPVSWGSQPGHWIMGSPWLMVEDPRGSWELGLKDDSPEHRWVIGSEPALTQRPAICGHLVHSPLLGGSMKMVFKSMAMTNARIATSLIASFPEKGDVLILTSFYRSKCCWICKSNLQNITYNFQIAQNIFEAQNKKIRYQDQVLLVPIMINNTIWVLLKILPF